MDRKLVVTITVVVLLLAVVLLYYTWKPSEKTRVTGSTSPSLPVVGGILPGAPSINVTVKGLTPGGRIPVEYTCDTSRPQIPTIAWTPIPSAKSYAIIVFDPDAPRGTFYHLVVYNIPSNTTTWPPGGTLGFNSAGKRAWFPVCPPLGHGKHRYYFLVLALSIKSFSQELDAEKLLREAENHILGYGYTLGTYSRP